MHQNLIELSVVHMRSAFFQVHTEPMLQKHFPVVSMSSILRGHHNMVFPEKLCKKFALPKKFYRKSLWVLASWNESDEG